MTCISCHTLSKRLGGIAMAKKKQFTYKYHVRFGKNPNYIDFDDLTQEERDWVSQQLSDQMADALGLKRVYAPGEKEAFEAAKPDVNAILERIRQKELATIQ